MWICRVGLYTELFRYYPYLVSMLFADLLSLNLVTFVMFFIPVHVTSFSSSLPSIRAASLSDFLSRCMQYWLKNH